MKKIMFSDKYDLTRAVLEGRKTMTRRIIKGRDIEWWMPERYTVSANIDYKFYEVVAVAQAYGQIEKEIEKEVLSLDYIRELPGYRNKMFVCADLMPHKIRIKNIRSERLQDISDEDCKKEGLEFRAGWTFHRHRGVFASPREAFAAMIDRISGKGTWERNPWVLVYEFELVK